MARRYRHLPWVSDTVISLDEGHQASHVNHVPIMPLVSMAPEDAAGLGTPSGAGAGSSDGTSALIAGVFKDFLTHLWIVAHHNGAVLRREGSQPLGVCE